MLYLFKPLRVYKASLPFQQTHAHINILSLKKKKKIKKYYYEGQNKLCVPFTQASAYKKFATWYLECQVLITLFEIKWKYNCSTSRLAELVFLSLAKKRENIVMNSK